MDTVLQVTQKALAQAMGHDYMAQHGYLEGISYESIVDIGKDVTDTDMATENYLKALGRAIGEYTILAFEESEEPLPMFIKNMDWGALTEVIVVGDYDVFDDPMFNPTHGNGSTYSSFEHDVYTPQLYVKVFDKMAAKCIPMSIPATGESGKNALADAFTSAGAYTKMINGLISGLKGTINKIRTAYSKLLVNTAIAVSDKSTKTAVHLLTEAIANGILPAESTVVDFLNSSDCLEYAIRRIKDVSNNMVAPTACYNNGAMPVPATKSNQNLVLLSQFETLLDVKIRANRYNDKYLDMGKVYHTPCWQSPKVPTVSGAFTFAMSSAISMSPDTTNYFGIGTEGYNKSGVIGVLYGTGACGFTDYWLKTTVGYTACTDISTQFHHEKFNMMLNPVIPIVAFIID